MSDTVEEFQLEVEEVRKLATFKIKLSITDVIIPSMVTLVPPWSGPAEGSMLLTVGAGHVLSALMSLLLQDSEKRVHWLVAVHQEHLYSGSICPWHWEQSSAICLHWYIST